MEKKETNGKKAIEEVLSSHHIMNSWKFIPKTGDYNIIKSEWVFRMKVLIGFMVL